MDQSWDLRSREMAWEGDRKSKCIEVPLVLQFLVPVSMRPGHILFPVPGSPEISLSLQ